MGVHCPDLEEEDTEGDRETDDTTSIWVGGDLDSGAEAAEGDAGDGTVLGVGSVANETVGKKVGESGLGKRGGAACGVGDALGLGREAVSESGGVGGALGGTMGVTRAAGVGVERDECGEWDMV